MNVNGVCPVCRREYARRNSLNAHMSRKHPSPPDKASMIAAKTVSCPVKEDCKVRLDENRSYHSTRRNFRNHLDRVHHVPLREIRGFLRTMLGELYRDSPEYEISELPVWPETFTVQLSQKEC